MKITLIKSVPSCCESANVFKKDPHPGCYRHPAGYTEELFYGAPTRYWNSPFIELENANKALSLLVERGHTYLNTWAEVKISHWNQFESLNALITAALQGPETASLLHWATRYESCNGMGVLALKLLLDSNPSCDLHAKCSQGRTPLDWAIRANAKECVDILKKRHAKKCLDLLQKDQLVIVAAKAKKEREAKEKAKEETEVQAKAFEKFKAELLEECYCSITSYMYYDPVSTADGEIYEREYIESWLMHHNTSPNTNEVLPHKDLIPCRPLKRLINKALEHYPQLKDECYLPYAIKQQVIAAVEQQQIHELERLLGSEKRFATENLRQPPPPPAVIKTSSPNLKTQEDKTSTASPSSSSPTENKPLFLLQLVCEQVDTASLKMVIKLFGNELHTLVRNQKLPATALEHLAKNVPAKEALKFLQASAEELSPEALYRIAVIFIKEGELESLEALFLQGLALESIDEDNNTLLHVAAQYNQAVIAQWLLTKNRQLEIVCNTKNQRPRDVAKAHGFIELSAQIVQQYQRLKLTFFTNPLEQEIAELKQQLQKNSNNNQAASSAATPGQ